MGKKGKIRRANPAGLITTVKEEKQSKMKATKNRLNLDKMKSLIP